MEGGTASNLPRGADLEPDSRTGPETILPLNVSDIITDFEKALFQSFSSGFPEADGGGCLFHYKKATYQTGILKNGLANLYSCDEQCRCWVQLQWNPAYRGTSVQAQSAPIRGSAPICGILRELQYVWWK